MTPRFHGRSQCVVVPFTKRTTPWRRKSVVGRGGSSGFGHKRCPKAVGYLRLDLSKEAPVRAWGRWSWWDCPGRLRTLGEKEGSENSLVMKGKAGEVETSKETEQE